MTVEEMKTIAGPWLSNDRHELILRASCFVRGWDACPHTTANARIVQQLIAGMRWIWLVYGRPIVAWHHIERTGRFNSYPRPGTDDTATRAPFAVCPVTGRVAYRDDFGVPRGTGGYHPHSGNDIHAPIGRAIRAPFAGLAVAHTDDWFAGRSVGLVGAEGFVRNSHLSRFAHLGYVRAGAVIGYVGQTGDALTPHDHFSWHPWNVPDPLHVAPSGFTTRPRRDRSLSVPESRCAPRPERRHGEDARRRRDRHRPAARRPAGGLAVPRWAELPLRPVVPAGTDNAIFRLGDSMAVRLPRIDWAIDQPAKEREWLPVLRSTSVAGDTDSRWLSVNPGQVSMALVRLHVAPRGHRNARPPGIAAGGGGRSRALRS